MAQPSIVHQLDVLRAEAAGCRRCPLWERATQTVFGEGAPHAQVMFVGEVPGDAEDKAGRPFVGPAGRMLDRAIERAGIDRADVWITNVVKHFKWVPRGKRRLHSKPNAAEIDACLPWLQAEIAAVRPRVLVCLGATAAHALLGPAVRVTVDRGKLLESPLARRVIVTVHPSALLREPDEERRHEAIERFVDDMRAVEAAMRK